MKITQIIEARQAIEMLIERKNLSLQLLYCISKFLSETQQEYDFYIAHLQVLMDKYARKDSNGQVFINDKDIKIYNRELNQLNDINVEKPRIQFPLSCLIEAGLSIHHMCPLVYFINEKL